VLNFSDNEAFLFAGYKQCTLQLAPDATRQLTYNLMPIAAGQVALPPIHVVARTASGGSALELVNNAGPRLLFVLPQPPVGMLAAT
jgi:hypothetical protein